MTRTGDYKKEYNTVLIFVDIIYICIETSHFRPLSLPEEYT